MKQRTYLAIDLKSFYASVECRERGLDPLDANLVVADQSRTDKTICLAVTPSLKLLGVPGRGRLFEARQAVYQVNCLRRQAAPNHHFTGKSCSALELKAHPELELDFIIAPPRMAFYVEYSTRIYEIYTRYVSPEDIIVYSIDEVFIDVTCYLPHYGLTARELAMKMIMDVLADTGVTATAGIGSNLFLAKVAMDIVAKHLPSDENGVRIAELDEMSFRQTLWNHRPLTDFWRIGRGTAARLEKNGMFTLGDVARCSVTCERTLYRLFGKNAELLIDHAWGWEPCTIPDIKAYRPASNSISSGQVLHRPYSYEEAGLILREMTEALVLDLLEKRLVTDQLVVTLGYDISNLEDNDRLAACRGSVVRDFYGRLLPRHGHGTTNLGSFSSSEKLIVGAVADLYCRIADSRLLLRRINITANHIKPESAAEEAVCEQLDLFTDYAELEAQRTHERAALLRERHRQEAVLSIRRRYGKNAILKASSLQSYSTVRDRNAQIGGHKA